jgi:Ribbon-helix-helix protein, copG family
MRVNARLDEDTARQLKALIERTRLSVSDIIKSSIDHYYRSMRIASPTRAKHIRRLIGKQGSGRSDVSVRSKEVLAESLAEKLGRSN